VSLEPTVRNAALTPALVLKLAVAGTLSLAVVIVVPRTVSTPSRSTPS
jgi:hypothetical protein